LLDAAAVSDDFYVTAQAGETVVVWTDTRDGAAQVRARWLLPDGSPDPQQPESGRVVSADTPARVFGVTGDGNHGVYVGWKHFRWGPPEWQYNRYMVSWVPYADVLAVPPGPAGTLPMLREPWPNPARDAFQVRFTLAEDSPARIELIDVAGHRVRSLEVRGLGEQTARFERLDDLAAGVYFVRLRHAGGSAVTKVALIE
jgi:hypothetical protein